MTTRRRFLAGFLAAGLTPQVSWADIGNPSFLSAAKLADGSYRLFGLTSEGTALFSVPLQGRGHAAAAHPTKAEAVAFARRPGTFAQVIDCCSGLVLAELQTPQGRHFMGHGAFTADGRLLLTPENDFEQGTGQIGIWDRTTQYTRVGEFASGGVGPHDIVRLPGSDHFVIANGGIDTHPESGRTPLNLATMRANLALFDLDYGATEITELDIALRLNSIRHLSLRSDGMVGFAMQWQGNSSDVPPLIGLYHPGSVKEPQLMQAPDALHRGMKNYAGSIAFSADGNQIAISSPRGGMVQAFDVAETRFTGHWGETDVCGLNANTSGYIATSGSGRIVRYSTSGAAKAVDHPVAWDNHLVALTA
ncbi:hypothetical protein TG4357_03580 [Thalassovita gelatinovora]|uniref:Twin-arginine translocation pathway signal n=1 Tax=Thalassovita gelatinovora TaxID=53501 RepID=A0A0P1G7E4_THAGE|nr:DUF1513 domain-containing protein [Thalassovita gelatinovora]QIZ82368.1 DUF1513 domain-containing protein [Thalassovita gelatinovora]CUH68437.1 hypothetical protein TG4357_03580 [Thalassovita gelatinovora]SEQ52129.1 hypothetical protein SAMN04488043_10641 [Thalassovita gelatinovora]